MAGRDDELKRMKKEINLSALAAAYGFELDRRSSSRNSVVMRHPSDGEKIVLGMDGDTWVYWAVHGGHAGSVIDFIMHRLGKNLGQARQELRPWLTGSSCPTAPPPSRYIEKIDPVPKDLIAVRGRYEAAEPLLKHHRYLNTDRSIPSILVASDRFRGRIRGSSRQEGCVLFPHWNEDGLCGYELKGPGVTRFAAGGTKGLWGSHLAPADRRLVVAETAIDALSYAALKDDGRTRYVSIAGKMNANQPALLTRAVAKLPPGEVEVVAAVDHDDGGLEIAEDIRKSIKAARRQNMSIVVDRPTVDGQDWNDVVREQRHPPSKPSPEP